MKKRGVSLDTVLKRQFKKDKELKTLFETLRIARRDAIRIELRTDLAIAIKKRIVKKQLTHAQAAKQSGMSRTVITALVNGNTTHLSTDQLIVLASTLGLRMKLSVAQ